MDAVAPGIFVPFFVQQYEGVPPFDGVAVNVTLMPEQIAPAGLAVMLTPATPPGFTIIVIGLEVAGDPLTQFALLVIIQVITSVLINVDEVYVESLAPVIMFPFFSH